MGLLFPPTCTICGSDLAGQLEEVLVCPACRAQIIAVAPACVRCARPLPRGTMTQGPDCAACKGKRFRFERTTALGIYGGVLREAVIRMKQAMNDPLIISMGQLLASKTRNTAAVDLIAPVPMHWLRRITRGVNCPEVLGEAVARTRGIPFAIDLLRCRRNTSKQGTLLPTERRANVRGAFAVSAGYDISSASVLVVDDVMTTGATANEVARVLRRSGARSVSFAVIARGIGFD